MTEEEKLAEEYFETECLHSYADTEEQLKEDVVPAFLKGAEFGYNKAKEEMQKNGLALQSDMDKTIEQNIQLKKQIEKMKCCRNCKKLDNRKVECSEGSDLIYFFGKNCDKWEIKGND